MSARHFDPDRGEMIVVLLKSVKGTEASVTNSATSQHLLMSGVACGGKINKRAGCEIEFVGLWLLHGKNNCSEYSASRKTVVQVFRRLCNFKGNWLYGGNNGVLRSCAN